MAIPKGRRQIAENILALYRNNLRDNLDLDAIMLQKYIDAVKAIQDKLEIESKELEAFAQRIAEERAKEMQLQLFNTFDNQKRFAVTPDKNLLGREAAYPDETQNPQFT